MRKPKTRWTREFKLSALSRMENAADVQALARELGINRELLYNWRRIFLAHGEEGLREYGRPKAVARLPSLPPAQPETLEGARQRIAELERLVGQQPADLDFFRAVLQRVRDEAPMSGAPGETASTR